MPINSENRIEIEAALIDNISRKLDVIDNGLDQITAKRKAREREAAAASVEAARTSTSAWTEFRSMYSTILDIVRVGQQVWAATGQEFVNYAEQVKNLSRSTGASAEETSRLIQVADDVRISYESLNVALKTAQKDGVEASVDSLAKLSDEYLKLQPGVERTQFLLDRFGKSGLEMGKLMEMGSEKIRAASEAIDENLVITEDGIKASDNYQKAQDDLNDSFTALKITVGSYLVGPATALLNHYRDITTSLKQNGYWYTLINQFSLDDIAAKREAADAAFELSGGNEDAAGSFEKLAGSSSKSSEALHIAEQAARDLEDSLKEMSQANEETIKNTLQVAEFQQGYEKEHLKAVQAQVEAQRELNDVLANQDSTDDEITNATESLNDANAALGELEASWHEKTQRMIYDMVLTKLSVDGLTDAEMAAAEQTAVQMGIITQAQAEQAQQMRDNANAIVEGILSQENVMREQAEIDKQRAEAQAAIEAEKAQNIDQTTQAVGETAQAVDNTTSAMQTSTDAAGVTTQAVQTTTEAVNSTIAAIEAEIERQAAFTESIWASLTAQLELNKAISNAGSTSTSSSTIQSRDSGGVGIAGVPYMIGKGAQPEIFIPSTNGNFIPNADKKMGATYNINITNPKGETTDRSVMRTLKHLSALGVPA